MNQGLLGGTTVQNAVHGNSGGTALNPGAEETLTGNVVAQSVQGEAAGQYHINGTGMTQG